MLHEGIFYETPNSEKILLDPKIYLTNFCRNQRLSNCWDIQYLNTSNNIIQITRSLMEYECSNGCYENYWPVGARVYVRRDKTRRRETKIIVQG